FGCGPRGWQLACGDAGARTQNICPPEEKRFDQLRALVQIKAFREGLVMVLARLEPSAIGCVRITSFFPFQLRGVFILDRLANPAEQTKKTLRQSICVAYASGALHVHTVE